MALALAVVGAAVEAYGSVAGCASMRVQESEPGGPPAQPECVREFTPFLLLLVAPPLLAAAGVLARLPWMAWVGAGLQAAAVPLFRLSTTWARAAVAVALLAAIAWWHVGLSRAAAAQGPVEPRALGRRAAGLRWAGAGAGALLVLLGGGLVAAQLPMYTDPCYTWGAGSSGSGSVEAGGPCSTGGASSLTKGQSLAIMLGIMGVPALLGALGIVACARRMPRTLRAAAVVLAAHGVVVFFLAVPALVLTWPIAGLWAGAAAAMVARAPGAGGGEAMALDGGPVGPT